MIVGFQEYTSYLKRNCDNNVIIVFDAYDGESNKAMQQVESLVYSSKTLENPKKISEAA